MLKGKYICIRMPAYINVCMYVTFYSNLSSVPPASLIIKSMIRLVYLALKRDLFVCFHMMMVVPSVRYNWGGETKS